jgi:lysophospholipase L1-like esterase
MHLTLLGDSTLDNASYTDGGPAVIDHLSSRLTGNDCATLLAVDGAIAEMVPTQMGELPSSATHLLLSVGGNDALRDVSLLSQPATSVEEGILAMADAVARFEKAYRAALAAVTGVGLPTTVCTIYTGDFHDAEAQRVINAALRMYNDVILQAALDQECPVIDLRRVCTEPGDYTQQIEPTVQGGRKIAKAIYQAHHQPQTSTVRVGPAGMRL